MADQDRIGADGAPLPIPVDGTQEYLAAILDELRGLRRDLSPRTLGDAREPEVDVRELIETIAEAEVTGPVAEAEPVQYVGVGIVETESVTPVTLDAVNEPEPVAEAPKQRATRKRSASRKRAK